MTKVQVWKVVMFWPKLPRRRCCVQLPFCVMMQLPSLGSSSSGKHFTSWRSGSPPPPPPQPAALAAEPAPSTPPMPMAGGSSMVRLDVSAVTGLLMVMVPHCRLIGLLGALLLSSYSSSTQRTGTLRRTRAEAERALLEVRCRCCDSLAMIATCTTACVRLRSQC